MEGAKRKQLVEQALSKVGSRYLVCSIVSKRASQLLRHPENQGVAWAVNQALQELTEDRLRYRAPTLDEMMPSE